MILTTILLIPLFGIFIMYTNIFNQSNYQNTIYEHSNINDKAIKMTGLSVSLLNLIISLIIFILFDFSSNQYQFVQEYHEWNNFNIYLGVDGISIYFVLLTTIITPIALLSNWTSISENVKSYVTIILLLETLLLAVFLVLDILLFYIFFESILPPLFLLIGIFGSSNKVRASFYLFLYTFYLKCKKAKHRGNPKALVTKVIKETFLLAWLMTQGMVTSLVFINLFLDSEKLNIVVDIWAIAVLSHFYFNAKCKQESLRLNSKNVKEQRVDGFSITLN